MTAILVRHIGCVIEVRSPTITPNKQTHEIIHPIRRAAIALVATGTGTKAMNGWLLGVKINFSHRVFTMRIQNTNRNSLLL